MNYIDLSCPAEIFRTAMPTEEVPAATVTLFNLSDRVIVSAEVLLRLLDEDGGETERLAYRGRALNGRPHSTFLMTVPCAPAEDLHSIDVIIEKVWYADNEVWRREPGKGIMYIPNNLPVSPALTKLKYAAGETAVGYPTEQDGLWLCVCGRPNPEEADICARCGRQKDMIFSRFSPEAVEAQVSMKERQLDLNSRSMREDTIRLTPGAGNGESGRCEGSVPDPGRLRERTGNDRGMRLADCPGDGGQRERRGDAGKGVRAAAGHSGQAGSH